MQAFEPGLTAALSARWPQLAPVVIAHDEARGLLLLEDAGTPIGVHGNPPEAWEVVLPRYAELQRGEAAHAGVHVTSGVPDLRLARLPERFERLLAAELPLEPDETARLRARATRFADECDELAAAGVPETIQHDDLHFANVYDRAGTLRVLDWGDASVAHPFFSLVVTFHFLFRVTKLPVGDPWFARLRDVYLEPWGSGHEETFALALRVGTVAHAVAWLRQREHLPEPARADFDPHFAKLLRHVLGGDSPATGW